MVGGVGWRALHVGSAGLDMPRAKILLVDHEVPWTLRLSELLIQDDCEMFSANSVADALLLLDARSIDVVIAEINMPGAEGTWDGDRAHEPDVGGAGGGGDEAGGV
jgi:hypothetical protein